MAVPKLDENSSINSWMNTVVVGDSLNLAKKIPTESVKCIVTSPPYFGHRQYSIDDILCEMEIGREKAPQEYIEKLVSLFEVLHRAMCLDGTLWLNLGDTYRDGQLLGIPWRVAIALQDFGWILRSEIIWHKPNAMPSSVSNRPTTDHEHIFLFSKTKDYFYNADAIREPHITFSSKSKMKGGRNHFGKKNGTPEQGKNGGNSNLHDARWDQAFHPLGRNKRTVWNIPLGKCRESHFAVFPEKLVELCILAGTENGDLVLDPFIGSGTTAIVAKKLQRNYLGFELIPKYSEMAINRIENIVLNGNLFS